MSPTTRIGNITTSLDATVHAGERHTTRLPGGRPAATVTAICGTTDTAAAPFAPIDRPLDCLRCIAALTRERDRWHATTTVA